jgi:hypothetical protein
MEHSETPPPAHLPIEHELSDASASPVVKFLVFLMLGTVVVAGLMVLFFNFLEAREAREKTARYPLAAGVARPLPPVPRLQTYPFGDIKDLRQEQDRYIEHYEWVDKSSGIVRIPVERAMEVLAERGLPHRETPPPTSGAAGAALPTGAASGEPPVTPAPQK